MGTPQHIHDMTVAKFKIYKMYRKYSDDELIEMYEDTVNGMSNADKNAASMLNDLTFEMKRRMSVHFIDNGTAKKILGF